MADGILGEEIHLRNEDKEKQNKEEEQRRKNEEEERRKKELEENLREEENLKRKEEDKRKRKEDEIRKKLDTDEKQKRELGEKKKCDESKAKRELDIPDKRKTESEGKTVEEETKEMKGESKKIEEDKGKQKENGKKEMETNKAEERRKEEEGGQRLKDKQEAGRINGEEKDAEAEYAKKKKEEEIRRKENEKKKADEEHMRKREDELKKKEQELRRREEELKKREEEEKRRIEERKREEKMKEEDRRRQEKETDERLKRIEEDMKKKEEEREREYAEEEKLRELKERKRLGEEAKNTAAEVARKKLEKEKREREKADKEMRRKREEYLRRREQDLDNREEELKKREEEERQRKNAEERKKQEENLTKVMEEELKERDQEGAKRNAKNARGKIDEEKEKKEAESLGKRSTGSVVGYGNVRILSSGLSETMQRTATECAIVAVNKFGADHMHLAQHIMMHFEQKYGAAWHCVASEEDLGFFIHYDTHINFCVGSVIICLFKVRDLDKCAHRSLQLVDPDPYIMSKPLPSDLRVIKSGMRRDQQQYAIGLAVSAFERFANDRMGMARYIMIGFEHVYGAPFHCVASRSRSLGFYVHYDPNYHMYFRVAGITIFIFRQQATVGEIASPFPEAAEPMEERTTQSVEYPGGARIIASGMPKDAQDFAIATAQAGLEQNFENEKMQMAQYIRNAFEEKYGAPFHCVVSDGQLGFYGHYDPERYVYFAAKHLTIFLFRHLDASAPAVRTERYVPPEETSEDVRIAASAMTPEMTQCAIQLAKEALAKYPDEKMHIAQHVVTGFEEWFGVPYHCILSDGKLGFNVGYDANNYAYFGVGPIAVFLFRNN